MVEVKGYPVPDGYMGYCEGQYRLFSTEDDYREYISEITEEENDD
jgi:hypothetical protein